MLAQIIAHFTKGDSHEESCHERCAKTNEENEHRGIFFNEKVQTQRTHGSSGRNPENPPTKNSCLPKVVTSFLPPEPSDFSRTFLLLNSKFSNSNI